MRKSDSPEDSVEELPSAAEGGESAPRLVSQLDKVGFLMPAGEVHRNYVLSTWILSTVDSATKRGVRRSVCRIEEEAAAKTALEQGLVKVLVDHADDTVIHGWICGKQGLLHWGYLPPELRKLGLFKSMVRRVCGKNVQYTRKSRSYRAPGYWVHNPYRVLEVGGGSF
jgi:hypothetical protein